MPSVSNSTENKPKKTICSRIRSFLKLDKKTLSNNENELKDETVEVIENIPEVEDIPREEESFNPPDPIVETLKSPKDGKKEFPRDVKINSIPPQSQLKKEVLLENSLFFIVAARRKNPDNTTDLVLISPRIGLVIKENEEELKSKYNVELGDCVRAQVTFEEKKIQHLKKIRGTSLYTKVEGDDVYLYGTCGTVDLIGQIVFAHPAIKYAICKEASLEIDREYNVAFKLLPVQHVLPCGTKINFVGKLMEETAEKPEPSKLNDNEMIVKISSYEKAKINEIYATARAKHIGTIYDVNAILSSEAVGKMARIQWKKVGYNENVWIVEELI